MDSSTDFIAFYRELGIRPECTPEELKRAYRRRVSELHPDRVGDRGGGEEALKALNLGYAAAQDFHRTHGRFPGAASVRPTPATSRSITRAPFHDAADGIDDDDAVLRRHPRWLLLALVLLLVVLVASQLMDNDATAGHASTSSSASFAEIADKVQAESALFVGSRSMRVSPHPPIPRDASS